MSHVKRSYNVGDKFQLSPEAIENYGQRYAGHIYTVSKWADHYAKPEDWAEYDPHGHPGFDESAGSAIYDADDLQFSVYEWEMVPAK